MRGQCGRYTLTTKQVLRTQVELRLKSMHVCQNAVPVATPIHAMVMIMEYVLM